MFTELAVSGLLSQGFPESHLRTAEDGREVLVHLDELQAQDPDAEIVAFLDVRMPHMDGEETARHIRSREARKPPFLVCCSANVESLMPSPPDDLFHMLMPKNFMDHDAVGACFAAAKSSWSGTDVSSIVPEIILADDEMICAMSLAANITLLGLEDPQTAEDTETLEELLQGAQGRAGPLMVMLGNPEWMACIQALSLSRKPFIVDSSVDRGGVGCHFVLQSQTSEEIQEAVAQCRTWWQNGCS